MADCRREPDQTRVMPIAARLAPSSDTLLPLTLLSRYLHFLVRRTVSASNKHFRTIRLLALQKLAPLLEHSDDLAIQELAANLSSLTPANLEYFAPKIQLALRDVAGAKLPRQVLVCSESPAPELFSGIHRVSLIFGPGIGIGDEILCFSLPAFFQAFLPEARIEVASMYDGLWNPVTEAQVSRYYSDLSELVEILREGDERDQLSCVIDFELPGLVPAVAREGRLSHYIELSIGHRSAAAFDARNQFLYRSPELNVSNFYHSLAELQRWIAPSAPARSFAPFGTARARLDERRPIRLLASPFTSKENPSLRYWCELLSNIVPRNVRRQVEFLLDTGPNHHTQAFAVALLKCAQAQSTPAVHYKLAQERAGKCITVPETITLLEDVDALIAADSFLAHAAGYFGCTACVLAPAGLEHWRAPAPTSFYFRLKDSGAEVALGIRFLLNELFDRSGACAREVSTCQELACKSTQLSLALASEAPLSELSRAWQLAQNAYYNAIATIRDWPKGALVLFSDQDYNTLWVNAPPCSHLMGGARAHLLRSHLRRLFNDWANSNLCKYLDREKAAVRQ
jgi:hypothetical protein